jgi:hypothetical protein
MSKTKHQLAALAAAVALSHWIVAAADASSPGALSKPPQAPPPAYSAAAPERGPGTEGLQVATTLYSIGDPTPEEQLYLEFINRARANPAAEGLMLSQTTDPSILAAYNFFSVDTGLLVSQFALIAPAPPLAMNEKLTAAAREHSLDMFVNVYQGHTNSAGSTPGSRVSAQSYPYQNVGENVYSTAESVPYGHAGFEVDWGPGVGGMQTPPGHRENIHNPIYREAGIGVVLGSNSMGTNEVGPQLVTQEMGLQQNAKPFITGVAYYDLNGNHFYDLGEGIGNISVTVNGQSTSAITARSGGYAVPVTGNGNYTVIFSATGLPSQTNVVTIASLENEKIDFTPAYTAPAVLGSASPSVDTDNDYTITPVGGASAYQWRQFQTVAAIAEGAENGSDNVTISITGSYNVFATDVKKSGSSSFHLVHPVSGLQIVALNPSYLPKNNASINFQSRLGYASPDQRAMVEVSTDDGATWTNIYTQAGSGSSGEAIFNQRTVSLASYAGLTIKLRFVYDFQSGSYFSQTDPGVGWYIDDITFSNTDQITSETVNDILSPGFTFKPSVVGTYGLQARAKTGHDFLPWGPIDSVQSIAPPLSVSVSGIVKRGDGGFDLNFQLSGATAPGSLSVEAKSHLGDAWQPVAGTAQMISPGNYQITIAPLARSATGFFRIVSN